MRTQARHALPLLSGVELKVGVSCSAPRAMLTRCLQLRVAMTQKPCSEGDVSDTLNGIFAWGSNGRGFKFHPSVLALPPRWRSR